MPPQEREVRAEELSGAGKETAAKRGPTNLAAVKALGYGGSAETQSGEP